MLVDESRQRQDPILVAHVEWLVNIGHVCYLGAKFRAGGLADMILRRKFPAAEDVESLESLRTMPRTTSLDRTLRTDFNQPSKTAGESRRCVDLTQNSKGIFEILDIGNVRICRQVSRLSRRPFEMWKDTACPSR